MEGKVIKFNLVGAILVLIIVVALIVFLVSFVFKENTEEKNKKNQDASEEKVDTSEVLVNFGVTTMC